MVLARVAEYLFPSDTISHHASTDTAAQRDYQDKRVQQVLNMEEEEDRPPYVHVSLDDDSAAGPRLTEFRQCLQEVLVV